MQVARCLSRVLSNNSRIVGHHQRSFPGLKGTPCPTIRGLLDELVRNGRARGISYVAAHARVGRRKLGRGSIGGCSKFEENFERWVWFFAGIMG